MNLKSNGSFLANRSYLVLPLALSALYIPVLLIIYLVTRSTGGPFMYPLDDPFIHMIVAKSLAFQGTWGIAGHEFESASSSILYTLLLAAAFRIFSIHMLIPLVINIIAGGVLVIVIQRWLKKENIRPGAQLVILLAVIFLTPLPVTIITGMEHTLQCLLSFLFIFHFSDWVAGAEKEGGNGVPWQIYVYGFLACAIRYEGLFLIGIVCLILLYMRRIRPAFLLGIVSILPILIFGLYSLAKGSYFLPNSVLLKGDSLQMSVNGIARFFGRILVKKLNLSISGITTVVVQHLLLILPLTYLLLSRQIKESRKYGYLLVILTGAILLQICLAAIGWFYRYEAYLVLSSLILLSALLYRYKVDIAGRMKQYPVPFGLIIFLLFLPFFLRSGEAFYTAPKACVNIYDQQYQMSQFLSKYYNNTVVAVNDIGAVSYYKEERNLDLYGLANIKVTRSLKKGYYTPTFLDSLCRSENAKIAIVYDSWFSPDLLHRWNKIATWSIPNNVICGDSVVSFYAIDAKEQEGLKRSLHAYEPVLPAGIGVRYFAVE